MSLLILDLEQNLIHSYRNIIKFIQTQNRTETEIKAPFGQDINLSSTILCLKFKNFDLKNFFYRVQSSQPPYTKMLLILQFWEGCHLMCASRPLFFTNRSPKNVPTMHLCLDEGLGSAKMVRRTPLCNLWRIFSSKTGHQAMGNFFKYNLPRIG
jgi:hypothetical protein